MWRPSAPPRSSRAARPAAGSHDTRVPVTQYLLMSKQQNQILPVLFVAVTMSIGWGFRGFIGGGPLGAMIPGALVALALCLWLRIPPSRCGLIAAFGAVGIGIGGEITYGQTVGFARSADTLAWGLTGLAVKGGVWGLLGGALLGVGLVYERARRRQLLIALLLMTAGAWAGWTFVNEPKLIYFSDPVDKPRPEIWFGFLLAGLAVLGVFFRDPAVRRLSLIAFIGGFLGFGGGGLWIYLGSLFPDLRQVAPWWKLMEYTFGFLFGAALAIAARGVPVSNEPGDARPVTPLIAALLIPITIYFSAEIPVRYGYLVLAVGLFLVAIWRERAAWHLAITVTSAAFLLDTVEYMWDHQILISRPIGWALAAVASLAVLVVVERRLRGRGVDPAWAFSFLLWLAFADASVKVALHPWSPAMPPVEWFTFAIGTGAAWILFKRITREANILPG